MAEYFMIGILCLINPLSGEQNCAYINENPIKYYTKEICHQNAVKKVNEMADNLTSKGFTVTHLAINCVVDNKKQNT